MLRSLILLLAPLVSATMKDCSSTNTIGHITNLSMDPISPVAGSNAIVKVDFMLDAPVTAGTVKYEVSFNGFPLTPTVNDLCTDLEGSTSPCPIVAGPSEYLTDLQMGDDTTHGTLAGKATWSTETQEILCWEFAVRI
jgi:hypothetical protein